MDTITQETDDIYVTYLFILLLFFKKAFKLKLLLCDSLFFLQLVIISINIKLTKALT